MAVQRIGLVVHQGRPVAVAAARTVRDWGADRGIACTEIDVWRGDVPRRSGQEEAAAAGHPDLIVTFGGDGTFLRGARIAAKNGAAVLGVNVGRLGFLTETTADGVLDALETVHAGRATVEERMMLTLRASRPLEMPVGMEALLCYGRGPALPPPKARSGGDREVGWGVALDVIAVNDVVLEKLARDRQASVGVYITGQLLAAYSADAVIVATPTGSTAYSFAAGGPVVSPYTDAVVFTPVAAHMAFDRTVVASADEAVAVRVLPQSGQVAVSIDGQLRGVLDPGDWVAAYKAPTRLRLVRLAPADFYRRLRERFQLADAPASADQAPAFVRPAAPVPADLAHLRLPPLPGS
ncbi:NAD(+)/NADH kinase [Streptantibioticus rubrisoli]|uniref:NAD kinase n=1 Tax=Streptantibioticus rubrisoli TaxID=1387313 RepID=A0ABT1P7L7_9ACTN|nr:NAD(+)/NADH kinase [Streptantibioticus rubrisoli]MCQ4041366.1 NAD(+)/NADH kinase [Streptantibioticus rubrisoli]